MLTHLTLFHHHHKATFFTVAGRHPGGFTANRQCVGGPAFTLRTSVALQPPWVAPAAPQFTMAKRISNKHGFELHDRGSSLTLITPINGQLEGVPVE